MKLDNVEIQNAILAEIHNRLGEISSYLKVGITLLAKLNDEEVLHSIDENTSSIALNTANIKCDNYTFYPPETTIGYTKERGLYEARRSSRQVFPLGDFERTAPIDEKTGEFVKEKGDEE